jgi:hypothetical protein
MPAHDGLLDEAGFLRAKSYPGERDASGMIIVRAKLPWISVERWRDGKRIAEPRS